MSAQTDETAPVVDEIALPPAPDVAPTIGEPTVQEIMEEHTSTPAETPADADVSPPHEQPSKDEQDDAPGELAPSNHTRGSGESFTEVTMDDARPPLDEHEHHPEAIPAGVEDHHTEIISEIADGETPAGLSDGVEEEEEGEERDGELQADGIPSIRTSTFTEDLPEAQPPRTPTPPPPVLRARLPSNVFIIQTLETIEKSREAKRKQPLAEAARNALAAIKTSAPGSPDPEIVFLPLRMACETQNTILTITSLDSIDKLISYGYFTAETITTETSTSAPLIERAIETISGCFLGDVTDEKVQMQVIKALLSAVLNDKFVVHGAGLLKAIRQTYNIFLLSRSSANQTVAQGALTQMVHMVFERVKTRMSSKDASLSLGGLQHGESSTALNSVRDSTTELGEEGSEAGSEATPTSTNGQEKITLASFENRKSFDDDKILENATTVTVGRSKRTDSGAGSNGAPSLPPPSEQELEDEIFIKDAFLVFRAMCKLSIKFLPADQTADLKSHGMRSKLLSLHLVHTILKTNSSVVTNPMVTIRGSGATDAPTQFVQAIKQYLCLSLSRNAASAVPWVFEVCGEIFWLVVRDMRGALKKELEVFMKEIYLAILDNKNSSVQQKQSILVLFEKLASDPKALVEIYLNYDCDRAALDNMFQRVIEHVSKVSSAPVHMSSMQQQAYQDSHPQKFSDSKQYGLSLPPSLSTAAVAAAPQPGHDTSGLYPVEYLLKRQSLDCLVSVLRSLVAWSEKGIEATLEVETSRESIGDRESLDFVSPRPSSTTPNVQPTTPQLESDRRLTSADEDGDDASHFEKVKQRKNALSAAIAKFNFKPKKGVKALIDEGFIKSKEPQDIAEFLLSNNERLDKGAIGEYIGEGEPEMIEVMHAFVDLFDFTRSRFVDALRRFLQSFRLPGEAQKIDRLMLKFATRYITLNPNAFANADTAYILSYSVIMLNTDQHSVKLKAGNRMTKEDFIKNNRGINDSADLPDEYLAGIFEEIQQNEIILETEKGAIQQSLAAQQSTGIAASIGQTLATVGRDLQREAYMQASEEMANKTEQLFKTLLRAQRKNSTRGGSASSKFVSASSFKHVGPMFEVVWMSFLSGLSGPSQSSMDIETIRLCMEGFKLAIRISCLFDLELPRISFVGALTKFTQLNNLSEMKPKNVEALRVLLDVAQSEGNLLKSSWKDVLMCVSQLERFQLISQGVDEGSVPDVTKSRVDEGRSSMSSQRPSRNSRSRTGGGTNYQQEVAEDARSREVVIAVDRIFANTAMLGGDAIVHFVRALCEVSWQEIQSSGQSESPRMFSLQKLVEISFYNMNRIRFEWSNIWAILGEHFNQVGCHSNTSIVFFALDSLRQLSMRFLEIEELPHFKFQKDFLKPFEHVMANSSHAKVKDMVLQCLNQMVQARGDNIRSGWRTMFGTYTFAAKEQYDNIVDYSFKSVQRIYRERFGVIMAHGAFADLVVCLTEFAKNLRFQKVSLQAIETLKATIPNMLDCPECPLSPKSEQYHGKKEGKMEDLIGGGKIKTAKEDPMIKYWFPVLFAFHDVLMTGEDLEVRSRALEYLFDSLIQYGDHFPPAFWDTICRQLLFPIFMVLKSRSEMSRFNNHEDMSVWLSTTMIQALRNLIQLFTHFFDTLERMLDGFLELLITCICQENDTIARIGSSCLQQLILQNVHKLKKEHWAKIVNAFVQLFDTTTAHQLFSAASVPSPKVEKDITVSLKGSTIVEDNDDEPPQNTDNSLKINGLETENGIVESTSEVIAPEETSMSSQQLEDYRPSDTGPQPAIVVTAARRRFFNKIITKCVLQLLMIETVSELFTNDSVYSEIPSSELLRLMGLLKKSFTFARRFNNDKELRMRLFKEGFMKQPPNLLKQESGSAATYISILFRMYHDEGVERRESRVDVEAALIPLCLDIIRGYVILDSETQQRNIVAWQPVVVDVMEGYTGFPVKDFDRNVETFYPVVIELLNRDLGVEIRHALANLLRRVGEVRIGMATPEPKGRRRTGSVMSGVGRW